MASRDFSIFNIKRGDKIIFFKKLRKQHLTRLQPRHTLWPALVRDVSRRFLSFCVALLASSLANYLLAPEQLGNNQPDNPSFNKFLEISTQVLVNNTCSRSDPQTMKYFTYTFHVLRTFQRWANSGIYRVTEKFVATTQRKKPHKCTTPFPAQLQLFTNKSPPL